MKKFPFYKQPNFKDCDPTCLLIVAKHYGKLISLEKVREFSETTKDMKKFKLEANEVLQRNELKTVFGGGGCRIMIGGYGGSIFSTDSEEESLRVLGKNGGGRYCCDSCDDATWL